MYGTVAVTYSDVQGGWSGQGNINSDPLFVGDGDYHIKADSPCIDAGNNSYVDTEYDVAGNWRIIHGTVEIGAYEYGIFKDTAEDRGIQGPSSGAENVVWADFNGDDYPDMYVTSSTGSNILYLNDGPPDQTFTDGTSANGVSGPTNSRGACAADYDNDGDVDLLVCNESGDIYLYRNNRVGLETEDFTEIALDAGLSGFSYSVMACWGDFDNDSYVDLYVVRSQDNCKLFKNDGDGTFTDVTSTAGVAGPSSGSSAVWCDIDNDNDLDLFVVGTATDSAKLYQNDGDGTFTDITEDAGADVEGSAVAFGDIDNDGDFDFCVAVSGASNYLLKNDYNGTTVTFSDITSSAGVSLPTNAVDCYFTDFNNDSNIDLIITADDGNTRLCVNNGDLTFSFVDSNAFDLPPQNARACGGQELCDGQQNGYIINPDGSSVFLEQRPNGNNWIVFLLQPTVSNRLGIGTRIELTYLDGEISHTITREMTAGAGWGSQGSFGLDLGLGNITKDQIQEVKVKWSSGIIEIVPPEHYELNAKCILNENIVNLDAYLYDGSVVPDNAESEDSEKEFVEGSVVVWKGDPVKIKLAASGIEETDKVVLSLLQPGGGDAKIKVWTDQNKTTEVTLPKEYDASDLPKELWVEGVNKSSTNVDTGLKLHLKGDTAVKDRVRFTVIWVDIFVRCNETEDVHTKNDKRQYYWDNFGTYDLGKFYSTKTGDFRLAIEYKCSIIPKDFNVSYSKRSFLIRRWVVLARAMKNDGNPDERKDIDDTSKVQWKDERPDYDGTEEKLLIFDLDLPNMVKKPEYNVGDVTRVRYNFYEYVQFVVGTKSVNCSDKQYTHTYGAIRKTGANPDTWDWTKPSDSQTGGQKYVEGEQSIGTGMLEAT
jgi:hypothetical protein